MKNHLLQAIALAPELVLVLTLAAVAEVDPYNFGEPVFITYTRTAEHCVNVASSQGYDTSAWHPVDGENYGECYGRKIAGVRG